MTKDPIPIDFTLHHPGNLYEGFLKKKGKNLIKKAPLRYVVIRNEAIYYFSTKKDENSQEQPDLSSCLGFINVKDLKSITGDESDHKITIVAEKKSKTKQFVFYTETKDSYTQWLSELKKWYSRKEFFSSMPSAVGGLSTFSSGVSAMSGSSKKSGTTEEGVSPSVVSNNSEIKASSSRSRFTIRSHQGGDLAQNLNPSPVFNVTSGATATSTTSGGTSGVTPVLSSSPTNRELLLKPSKKHVVDDDVGTETVISDDESEEIDDDEDHDDVMSTGAKSGSSTRSRGNRRSAKKEGNLLELLNSKNLEDASFRRHSVMLDKSDRSSSVVKFNLMEQSSIHSGSNVRKNDEDQFDKRRFLNIMSIFPVEKEHSRYFDDGKRVDLTTTIPEVKEWEQELINFETKRAQKSDKQNGNTMALSSLVPHDFADAKEKCKETLQQEDKFCYWSHEVIWFNPRAYGKNQYKEALLVLGNRNVYIIDAKSFKTETKVRINDIYHIVQSGYEDDIVGIIRKDREEQFDILFQFTETKRTKSSDDTSITVEDEERIRGKSFADSRSEAFKEQENEIYLKKVEFFDYISAVYASQRSSPLKIFFVLDVKSVCRTEEREEPFDLNPKNILESTSILQIDKRHDFIKLYQEPTRCKVMSEFGDKQVFFAGLLGKKNKRNKYQNRTIVITNRALYLFDPKKQKSFKRRIKLSEISRVYRNKKKGVLIDVPSEYPLCLVPKQNMEVFEDFVNVLSSLYFDNDLVQHVKDNEFDSFDLEKSQVFKEKMNETEDVLFVQTQLRNAIFNKDVNQVREYLAYADALVGKKDQTETNSLRDLRIQASEFLGDIQLQEFIKEKLQAAFINKDFLEMSRMLEHIETIKKERGEAEICKSLSDYLKSIKTEKDIVINKHLLLTRIEFLLESGVDQENERRIMHAVDIAKRAGFVREVEQYKQDYDREKQKIYIDQQLAEILDRKAKSASLDSDADRLICLIENSKSLGIYEGKIQKIFEENTKAFITNKSNNHNFKMAIEQTRKDIESNHAKLKKEIEKVQSNAEGYTNIDKALVEEAKQVIQEIEEIRKYQRKLHAILDKTEKKKYTLEEAQVLIEKCKKKLNHKRKGYGETKDYRELLKRTNNTYNELKRELKKIYKHEAANTAELLRKLLEQQEYGKLQEKLNQINTLSIKAALVAEFPELQKVIDEVVDNLNTYDFMSRLKGDNVEAAYTYLDVEKVLKFKDFAERNPQYLTEDQQMSLARIEKKVATEYKYYNEILEEKKRFKDISAEIVNFQRVESLLEQVSDIPSLHKEAGELADLVRRKKTFNQYVRDIQKRKTQGKNYDDIMRKASKEDFDANIIISARKDVRKLQELISRNAETMPKNLLKIANAKLNNLRRENMTPLELIEQINNAIDVNAKEELISAVEVANKLLKEDIAEQSKSQLSTAIERANRTIKSINDNENIVKVKQFSSEFIKQAMHCDELVDLELENEDSFKLTRKLRQVQGLTDYSSMTQEGKQKYLFEVFQSKSINTDNELLQRLTYHVNKLRAFCEAKEGLGEEEEKYTVERDNVFGQNLIKVLYDILNHKTKKRFFYLSKDPYEILSGLKNNNEFILKLVDTFDSNDLVKRLKKEKKSDALSVQFIYYLLSQKAFMFVVEQLLTSDDYLKECYELDSVILDRRYRDDIYPLMSLLNMFKFEFTLSSSTDVLAASPISKLKGIVRAIVHYFVANRAETKSNLELSGKETWEKSQIGILIRQKLVPTLAEILNHKFKSGFISKYHIWQFIQDVAEQRRISAIDIGGIHLPAAVDAVNNNTSDSLDFNFKFEMFVCYALNRGLLAEFFESILKDRSFLNKYYDQYALVLDRDVIGNSVKYFEIISQLPFELIEDSAKYYEKYPKQQ
ncbi:hypothetical protein FDP41_004789 [Naegleria fowleri]|uniref:PH domain-containing protein n=1 Tax=Naegleria fowleri TaxID=5763 RepID=A0A6A5BPS8_NAEFO|nr:uncharacterized protein FDP41_004789 [Naegleria fowleri]KAF0976114.1 hypothetical protein FDP41_004789 [Naegleria fowleri]